MNYDSINLTDLRNTHSKVLDDPDNSNLVKDIRKFIGDNYVEKKRLDEKCQGKVAKKTLIGWLIAIIVIAVMGYMLYKHSCVKKLPEILTPSPPPPDLSGLKEKYSFIEWDNPNQVSEYAKNGIWNILNNHDNEYSVSIYMDDKRISSKGLTLPSLKALEDYLRVGWHSSDTKPYVDVLNRYRYEWINLTDEKILAQEQKYVIDPNDPDVDPNMNDWDRVGIKPIHYDTVLFHKYDGTQETYNKSINMLNDKLRTYKNKADKNNVLILYFNQQQKNTELLSALIQYVKIKNNSEIKLFLEEHIRNHIADIQTYIDNRENEYFNNTGSLERKFDEILWKANDLASKNIISNDEKNTLNRLYSEIISNQINVLKKYRTLYIDNLKNELAKLL